MKHTYIIAALLLGSVVSAHADVETWRDATKRGRANPELQVDGAYCTRVYGVQHNGEPDSKAYTRCMHKHGWRLESVAREKTWIDPDTGDTCKDIGNDTSWCSNF
jgi:hypothetical protein